MKHALQNAGHKLTASRVQILEWMEKQGKVFSAKEILQALPTLDKVSVYRTLDLLAQLDLIHPVLSLHGELHYERHGAQHHHHVICEQCEDTECIPCPISGKKLKTTFTHIHHTLIYTGLCGACI